MGRGDMGSLTVGVTLDISKQILILVGGKEKMKFKNKTSAPLKKPTKKTQGADMSGKQLLLIMNNTAKNVYYMI